MIPTFFLLGVGASKLSQPSQVKGLGDRGGETVSRFSFRRSNRTSWVYRGGSTFASMFGRGGSFSVKTKQAVVVFPWLIEPAYAHSSFDYFLYRKASIFRCGIERQLGMDIDPYAYPDGNQAIVVVFLISLSLQAIFTGTWISSSLTTREPEMS